MNGFIDYFPIEPDQYWIFGADTEIKEVRFRIFYLLTVKFIIQNDINALLQ